MNFLINSLAGVVFIELNTILKSKVSILKSKVSILIKEKTFNSTIKKLNNYQNTHFFFLKFSSSIFFFSIKLSINIIE